MSLSSRVAPRTRSRIGAVAASLLLLPTLAACSGDSDGPDDAAPEEVLAQAAEELTETSGIELSLTTDDLPQDVTGITKAEGTATHAPAFEGDIAVVISGQQVDVPVVAVDDLVYAQLPFTDGWNEVDPAEYGAPDPAGLIDPDDGFPALLGRTVDPEKGQSVRGGAGNTEILTTYSGTVRGEDMKKVIPSASGDTFTVEWQVTEDGQLRRADLTGVFYAGSDEMTYTVTFNDYGVEKDIAAP